MMVSITAPAWSSGNCRRTVVGLSTTKAGSKAQRASTAWMTKRGRQPTQSTITPPTAKPVTAAPDNVPDAQAAARTRSSGGKTWNKRANDAGTVAVPASWAMVRKAITEPASHASAVRRLKTMQIEKPTRYT